LVTDDSMQRMNPVTGAIKFLLSTTLNAVLSLVFFLAVAHFQTPTFVGRVAIIQLLELTASSALTYLSPIIYTREISQSLAKHTPDTAVVGTVLTSILVATPTLLILLLFPTYIWLSIPYLALYVYSNTLANIAAARGLFTQSAISAAIFSVGRWGLSAIPAYYGSVPLLILIWTAGAAVKTAYLHLAVRGLPLKPHFSLAKQIFIEGLPLYISSILSFASSQGDRITTAFLLGSKYLGIYQLSALIATAPLLIASAIAAATLPAASYYVAKGLSIQKMSALSLRFTLFLYAAFATTSLFLAPIIIKTLFPAYTPGITSFKLLILATMLGTPFTYLTNFIAISRKTLKPMLYITTITATLITITSIILIPRLGIIGAAISQTTVQLTATALITIWATTTHTIKFNKREITVISAITASAILTYMLPQLFFTEYLLLARPALIIDQNELKSIEEFIPEHLKFIVNTLTQIVRD